MQIGIAAGGGARSVYKSPYATPDPIWFERNPQPRSIPAPAGVSGNNGWILVQFVCTTLPTGGAVQTILSLHGGSTVDALGLRITNSGTIPNTVRSWLRKSSANKYSEKSYFGVQANEIKTAVFVWREDGYQYEICDDELTSSTQTEARGMTFTTLSIGSRNSGLEPLVGRVLYAEIGNVYIDQRAAAERLAQSRLSSLVVSMAGQSNIYNWSNSQETNTPVGRDAFNSILSNSAAVYCVGEVVQSYPAVGGTSLFKAINPAGYWIEDGLSPSPLSADLFARLDRISADLDILIWDQGEADCHYIDKVGYEWLTKTTYKARLLALFILIKSRYPRVKIGIGILGRRTSGYTNTGGIQKIVEAQQELIAENSWLFMAYERHDLQVYTDGVHYYDTAYITMGQRAARRVQQIMGYPVSGTQGPSLISAVRSGTTLTITLAHDGGTDFTPSAGIDGFKYIDLSGNNVPLSSVVRASATTITATLASGVAGTLYYIYDDAGTVNTANMIHDNHANAMPLRRAKLSVS